MGEGSDLGSFLDILAERLAGAVEHHGGEPAIDRLAAFLNGVAMIEMDHDWHGRLVGEMTEHGDASTGSGVCFRQPGPACRMIGACSASAAATKARESSQPRQTSPGTA